MCKESGQKPKALKPSMTDMMRMTVSQQAKMQQQQWWWWWWWWWCESLEPIQSMSSCRTIHLRAAVTSLGAGARQCIPPVWKAPCVHTTSHPNEVMSTCYMLFWLPVSERLVFDRSFVSMCPTHKSRKCTKGTSHQRPFERLTSLAQAREKSRARTSCGKGDGAS